MPRRSCKTLLASTPTCNGDKGTAEGGLNGGAVLIALQLLGALGLVVIASDAFTNAVEWLGAIFGLTRSAVGAVVAAIGSSLPETMVAIVALLFLRDAQSHAIGVGAVLGAPFMLSTLVFFLIGVTALLRRAPATHPHHSAEKPHSSERPRSLHKLKVPFADTLFGALLFVLTFALALGASFVPDRSVHITAAILVLGSYGLYLLYHLRSKQPEAEESPPPLRISPKRAKPSRRAVVLQLAIALVITIFASRWFVSAVGQAANALNLSPFMVSLFLAPIATELPDASNVVIWMRRRQDELAMGSVLGAMMFQTSIACAIAMLATPWHLDTYALVPSAIAIFSALLLVVVTLLRRRVAPLALVVGGLLYVGYIVYVAGFQKL